MTARADVGEFDSLSALINAALDARRVLRLHHWTYNPPGDQWPAGSWSSQEARRVYERLGVALERFSVVVKAA
jgi:hypothetical protein